MSSPLLEVKDLQVVVGEENKVLLDGLNLTVNAGETHVLMGHNGAGKSTLMSALMGDPRYTVTRGQIIFRGQDITHETADVRARAGMFLSFQTPEEIPGITLESFLRTAAGAVTGKPVKVMKFRREMAAQMEALNMDPSYADRYLNVGFSGGEKKKAEILQLLMLKPALALLDETDSGLDVDAVKTVASGIKAYHNADNALIIITHNAKILEGLQVDYVHVLDDARIVRTGNGRHYLMLGATADGTTVQLAFDVTETYTVRQTQQRAYHTTFVILIVIGAAVSWLTSYLLTRPLSTLSRASRELARGNLSYRAPVRSHDEVGQLAADFNRMAGQLEQNVNRIQETMALQERFMADFSHEMKTPMTSIIGYADLLRSQVLTPDEQMDAANYIFSEGKRLEALGLKLLDMLSLDQSKLQLVPAHPADLVAGLLEHLKRLYAQKGIALQYRTEEGACFLEPDLFKTLLVNLMDNARKALDSGGNIYVWQEMLPDGCRVRVLDNGRGIPPEALAHLTEAFYRVDKSRSRAQGGAGLGLSLCNEIVQLHGGTMQFESRVGNGTVVTVELKGGRV